MTKQELRVGRHMLLVGITIMGVISASNDARWPHLTILASAFVVALVGLIVEALER